MRSVARSWRRHSWKRNNAEAEKNPRIAACIADIVDDLAKGVDIDGGGDRPSGSSVQ